MTLAQQKTLKPCPARSQSSAPAHVTSPAPREVWHEVLNADSDGLAYQSPAWLDAICEAGGYRDASRLYELANGQKIILPMVASRGPVRCLAMQASLPNGWGMGGLVSTGPISAVEIAVVFADLQRLPCLRTAIRPNPLHGAAWAAAAPRNALAEPLLAHVLDLEGGFDAVWSQRFKKNTRSRIRKAERENIVVECDTTGKFVPIFYDLLERSVERWARQHHEPLFLARWRARQRDPRRKFEIIARILGQACRFWVAWVNGEPAAATMVLQGGNVNDARAVMDKDIVGTTGAADLLLKLSIEEACTAGCRYYHLGESGQSKALADYKARFGAEPHPYARYSLERLPLTHMDRGLRRLVKSLIGFRDHAQSATAQTEPQ